MENCLVKKIKGVIDNNNQVPFGVLRYYYTGRSAGTALFSALSAIDPIVLTIIGDATWHAGQSHVTYIDTKNIKIEANRVYTSFTIDVASNNTDFIVQVNDKYKLASLLGVGGDSPMNVENYEFLVNLTDLSGASGLNVGDIKYFYKLAELKNIMTQVNPANNALYGDISVFANLENIENITMQRNTGIYGDISVLSALTHLTSVNFRYDTGITGDISSLSALVNVTEFGFTNSQIEGNLNMLLDALYANGKTGNLRVQMQSTNVTYTGTTDVQSSIIDFVFDENGWSEA